MKVENIRDMKVETTIIGETITIGVEIIVMTIEGDTMTEVTVETDRLAKVINNYLIIIIIILVIIIVVIIIIIVMDSTPKTKVKTRTIETIKVDPLIVAGQSL